MADFNKSIGFTLQNEGGFTNVPQDSGGATNFGITDAVYSSYLGRAATVQDVKHMPIAAAMAIYEKHYWAPLNLDHVNDQGMATAIFDMGVNMGILMGAELAQDACNSFGPPKLEVDGEIGPMTLARLNAVNPRLWLSHYVAFVRQHYDAIIASHPKDAIFRAGWMSRANRLLTLG